MTTTGLAERLGSDAPACIDAAIAKVQHDMRPVPEPGDARAQWANAMDERLRRLAVKVLPTAKPVDTQEWRTAMVDALSDLPAMVALTAAKRAIHRAYRFIGEIEAAVREIATELQAERLAMLAALERHRAEILAALAPPPALPAPGPDAPVTPAQIRAMARLPAWPDLRAMGLTLGSFTEDDIAAALPAEESMEAVGA